jgi:putative transcriptional regulator
MESTQGKLLIASTRLLDPNFSRSVLLMIQHNEDGAFGLVLNRPLTATVREACEAAMHESCKVDDVLRQGGPCDGPLMVLHAGEFAPDVEVAEGLFFTTDRVKIESLLNHPETRARYFVGYSGWVAGQLEAEMETGSWLVSPLDIDHALDAGPKTWSHLMTKLTMGQWIDEADLPDDPTMN